MRARAPQWPMTWHLAVSEIIRQRTLPCSRDLAFVRSTAVPWLIWLLSTCPPAHLPGSAFQQRLLPCGWIWACYLTNTDSIYVLWTPFWDLLIMLLFLLNLHSFCNTHTQLYLVYESSYKQLRVILKNLYLPHPDYQSRQDYLTRDCRWNCCPLWTDC